MEHLLNIYNNCKLPSLNSSRTETMLLRKCTPGKRLSLSKVLWILCRCIKNYTDFPGLFMFKIPCWGMQFVTSLFYFASSLLNWRVWPKIMHSSVWSWQSSARSRFFWNFISSDSKLFFAIFWLAGKRGTSLFDNKPVSTQLSLIIVFSLKISRDLISSGTHNLDDSFDNVPYDSSLLKFWTFWPIVHYSYYKENCWSFRFYYVYFLPLPLSLIST